MIRYLDGSHNQTSHTDYLTQNATEAFGAVYYDDADDNSQTDNEDNMPKLDTPKKSKAEKKDVTETLNTAISAKKKPSKSEWQYSSLADDEDIVNMLYYGDAGTGKTTALASIAKQGKVVYIEAESGLKKAPLARFGVPIQNLMLVRDTAAERQITFKKLEALCNRLRVDLSENPKAITAVIFDSVTEIQKKLLRQVMDKRIERFSDRGQEVETHKNVVEDYGINTEQMRDLIRMYRDLPCHVGFAGLEVRDEDDDGAVTYRPNLTPKLSADLTGYVDLVCYTTDRLLNKERVYLGSFKRGGKYSAKDRFGLLPDTLINPTFDRVVMYVNGTLTEDTDKEQQKWLALRDTKKKKTDDE